MFERGEGNACRNGFGLVRVVANGAEFAEEFAGGCGSVVEDAVVVPEQLPDVGQECVGGDGFEFTVGEYVGEG